MLPQGFLGPNFYVTQEMSLKFVFGYLEAGSTKDAFLFVSIKESVFEAHSNFSYIHVRYFGCKTSTDFDSHEYLTSSLASD